MFRKIAEFKHKIGKFCVLNIKNTFNSKLFKSIVGDIVIPRGFSILRFLNIIAAVYGFMGGMLLGAIYNIL